MYINYCYSICSVCGRVKQFGGIYKTYLFQIISVIKKESDKHKLQILQSSYHNITKAYVKFSKDNDLITANELHLFVGENTVVPTT